MRRLVIRPGAIGDCVLSLPAMECLRAEYTEVWVESRNVPLVRFADRVESIARTSLDLLGIPGRDTPDHVVSRLRGFDSIVSWYGANRPEFHGAVRDLGLPFTFLRALPEASLRVHAADFWLGQARAISSCECDAVPRIACPRGSAHFAAIHPFSGSRKKNWPLERYLNLTRWLEQRMPVKWILEPGSPAVGGVDAAGPVADLYELACRLATARLYMGNDSGITHLAAAAGTPVVAIFGPTDPAVWAPRGPNVRIVAPLEGRGPVEGVSLDRVITEIQPLLE